MLIRSPDALAQQVEQVLLAAQARLGALGIGSISDGSAARARRRLG